MKIGIDTQIIYGQKTGFGFYTENLINSLSKLDSDLKFEFIKPNKSEDLSTPQRILWDQFGLPKAARIKQVDLIHQTAFSVPIFARKKKVVTVHDLIAIEQGGDIPFWSRNYFGKFVPFTYKFADHLIAVSNHTKDDMVRLLNIPEEKISVVYEAADQKFKPIENQDKLNSIRKKYNLEKKFILHVGTLSPRKNIEFLIKVFAEVVGKHSDYELVIAGKKGWYADQIIALAQSLNIKDKVNFIGYIDEEDKVALYNCAALLAYPSLYEGFGLPPLEAMACGVPVMASNISSIPEVVGEAGILLSPTDKKAWVNELDNLLNDNNRMLLYKEKGLLRAEQFSWDKTARETIKVYQKVLSVK